MGMSSVFANRFRFLYFCTFSTINYFFLELFRSTMRGLLASLDSETDPCTHTEFRRHVQNVCSRYVAGAWENVTPEKLEIKRIK